MSNNEMKFQKLEAGRSEDERKKAFQFQFPEFEDS
jgi:hypothetical protein